MTTFAFSSVLSFFFEPDEGRSSLFLMITLSGMMLRRIGIQLIVYFLDFNFRPECFVHRTVTEFKPSPFSRFQLIYRPLIHLLANRIFGCHTRYPAGYWTESCTYIRVHPLLLSLRISKHNNLEVEQAGQDAVSYIYSYLLRK